jgi:hypothetical protein
MKGIDVLRQFQTGIVGIIGFAGVIITLLTNAKIARNAREDTIRHERSTLRTALCEELQMLRDTYAHNAEFLSTRRPGPGEHLDVPLLDMTNLFDSMHEKLGLLTRQQLAAVLNAYMMHRQMRHNMVSLLGGTPIPSATGVRVPQSSTEILRKLYEKLIPEFDKAINALKGDGEKTSVEKDTKKLAQQ